MKKIFRLAFMAAAMFSAATFSACTESDEYDAAQKDATPEKAFLYTTDGASSYTFLPDMAQNLTIKIARADSASAATVTLTCDNSKFKVPSSVSFSAGEGTKTVDVPFDMVTGTTEKLTIAVAPENAYQYGNDTLRLSIKRDYTWVKFKDKGLFTNSLLGPDNAEIEIAWAKEQKGLYKLYRPFASVVKANGLDEAGFNDFTILVDPTLKKGGAFTTSYSGYTDSDKGKIYHYCESIFQTDNVITMKGYGVYIADGNLKPAYYDNWTITLPDE